MIIFSYEHEWGMVAPRDDEIKRLIITSDDRNNVVIWRGLHCDLSYQTIPIEDVWDIQDLIVDEKGLFDGEQAKREYCLATDTSTDWFYFRDDEGRNRLINDSEFEKRDKIGNLIDKIQGILRKNDIIASFLDW